MTGFDFREPIHYLSSETYLLDYVVYKPFSLGSTLYLIMSIASIYIVPTILESLNPIIKYRMICTPATRLRATHLLVATKHTGPQLIPIRIVDFESERIQLVEFKLQRFISKHGADFERIDQFQLLTDDRILRLTPLGVDGVAERELVYGTNNLEAPITPIKTLVSREVFHFANVYQIFVCFVWYFREYGLMSTVLLIITFFNVVFSVYEIRTAEIQLRELTCLNGSVNVLRVKKGEQEEVSINIHELVPGDIILLSSNTVVPCDLLITEGEMMVNEAILTGESIPVIKTSAIDTITTDNLLFCGCRILKVYSQSNRSKAIVVRTGFHTIKGSITRDIIYPKVVEYKHEKQAKIFIISLLFLIFILQCWFVYWNIIKHPPKEGELFYTILIGMDILFTGIPPMLIVALMVGRSIASHELDENRIKCFQPQLISAVGRIGTFCFDKTGTLTTSTMILEGVAISTSAGFDIRKREEVPSLDQETIITLLTCHNITLDGIQMFGDPMEIELFQSASGQIDTSNEKIVTSKLSHLSFKKTKLFEFKNSLHRMSIISEYGGKHLLCCKGSPETLKSLCIPDTIPNNYDEILTKFALLGIRVLAYSCKELDQSMVDKPERSSLEANMRFKGFLLLKNKLKETTELVIKELTNASINTVMITGDNIQTAASIAKECGILPLDSSPHLIKASREEVPRDALLVVSGEVLEDLQSNYPEKLALLLPRIKVFARTTPAGKRDIVKLLKNSNNGLLGYCGDGANDTLALKEADIGVSLSTEESSFAAPFVSSNQDLKCIVTLIGVGRATLVSYFQNFKYFLFEAMVQDLCLVFGYYRFAEVSTNAYLWMDAAVAAVMTYLLMKLERKKDVIGGSMPTDDLFKKEVLLDFWVCLCFSIVCIYLAVNFTPLMDGYMTTPEVFIALQDNGIEILTSQFMTYDSSVYKNC